MSEWNTYGGNCLPIGKMDFFPEGGAIRTLGDGSVWLRTGVVVAKGTYPVADAIADLFVNGIPANLPNSPSITQVASNGAGTIIICFGDATNILRSTDNGASFVLTAHGQSFKISAVCWGNGQFIIGGNTNTAVGIANSTTGTAGSWTARTVTGVSLTGVTVDSMRLAWNGTEYRYVLAADTSIGSSGYSGNGSAWTATTIAVALGAPLALAGLPSKWVVFGNSSSSGLSGNNGGAMNVAVMSGLFQNTPMMAAGPGMLVLAVAGVGISTSTDGMTFTVQTPNIVVSGSFMPRGLGFDGSRFLLINQSNQLVLTADFINFSLRAFNGASSANVMQIVGDGAVVNYFDRGAGSSLYYRSPNIVTSDYTGTNKLIWLDPTTKQALGYIKLKG